MYISPRDFEAMATGEGSFVLRRMGGDGEYRYWSPLGEFKSCYSAAAFNTRGWAEKVAADEVGEWVVMLRSEAIEEKDGLLSDG